MSRHIKLTEGAQRLVADGNTKLDAASLDLDHVDIYCRHSYAGPTPEQIVTNATTVHSHGKAFFLGEYTWTDKDTIGFGTSWTLTQMLSAIEASTNVDGDNFWELLAPLAQFGGGFALHWPGDNANMVTRATQLADHALQMRHLTPPE